MDQSQTQTLVRANGFRWMDFDAYLFDIDGTLLVTRDLVHYNALNRAIREVYEVEATIDGIPYHGKTDLGFFAPCSSVLELQPMFSKPGCQRRCQSCAAK